MTEPTDKSLKWAVYLARKLGITVDDVLAEYMEGSGYDEDRETGELREDLEAQLDAVLDEGDSHDDLIPGSTSADFGTFFTDVTRLRAILQNGNYDALVAITDEVEGIRRRFFDISDAVGDRLEAERRARLELHGALSGRAEALEPFGIVSHQTRRFETARRVVTDALAIDPVTDDSNQTAGDGLNAIETLRGEIEQEIRDMGGAEGAKKLHTAFGDNIDGIEDRLGGRANLIALTKTFGTDALVDLIATFGGGETGATYLKNAMDAFGSLAIAKQAIEDIGDAQLLAMTGSGSTITEVAGLYDKLGPAPLNALFVKDKDLKRAQLVLAAFGDDTATFKDLVKDTGLSAKPDALAAMLDPGCDNDPARFAALANGFDTPEKRVAFGGLVGDGGLGDSPAALGALARDAGAAGLAAMGAAFDDDAKRKALKDALTTGGLSDPGVDPKCLAELLNNGAAGDADTRAAALATLLGGLTPTSLPQMKGMLVDGGLGASPESFAVLVRDGCNGDPRALNAMLGATNSDAGKAGMKNLLTTSGMDGTVPGGAACLADMLQASGTDAATRGAGFGALVTGITPTIATDFKTVLDQGGMAAHPKVLGQMVVKGCRNTAGDLGAMAAAISADATSQANLTGLLNTGGFGARDAGGTATNTKPECLAELYGTGCGGDPAELTKLLAVMGGPQQTQMCKLMKEGGLGDKPLVLANMYKHGCLTDGEDAATGPKNPTKLTTVLTSFDVPGGPALFNEMMITGGFGANGKEERLGSVLRYGFTDKATGVANPADMYAMINGFHGSMGDLDTTLNAMETAPAMALPTGGTEALQPGGGLQNVKAWGRSPADLKTKFFDRISAAVPGGPPAGAAPDLGLDTIIQTAASFENTAIPAATSRAPSIGGTTMDVRADHILGRHTRKYKDLNEVKKNNTLFPAGLDAADIDALATATIQAMPLENKPHNRQYGFAPPYVVGNPTQSKKMPPRDIFDFNSDTGARAKPRVPTADGYTVNIGFKRSETPGSTEVMLDQFYPDQAGNLPGGTDASILDVNKRDMIRIRKALQDA